MWLLTPPIRDSYENISASTRHHLSIDLHLRDLPCGEPPPSLTQASDCSSHLSASSSPQHSLFRLARLKGITITVEWLSLPEFDQSGKDAPTRVRFVVNRVCCDKHGDRKQPKEVYFSTKFHFTGHYPRKSGVKTTGRSHGGCCCLGCSS